MVVGAPELPAPQAMMLPAAFIAIMALLLVKIWVKPVPVASGLLRVPPFAASPQVVMEPSGFRAAKAEAVA